MFKISWGLRNLHVRQIRGWCGNKLLLNLRSFGGTSLSCHKQPIKNCKIMPPQQPAAKLLRTLLEGAHGAELVSSALSAVLPPHLRPHDWQLEATLSALQGHDILCTVRTGGGKSAIWAFPLLAALRILETELVDHQSHGLVGVYVVPTNLLGEVQVSPPVSSLLMTCLQSESFGKLGIDCIHVTAETIQNAGVDGRDLWKDACDMSDRPKLIICGPEMTLSTGFHRFRRDAKCVLYIPRR